MRVAQPPLKPLLIYDGDCGFCKRWIARWELKTGEAVAYAPSQDAEVCSRFPEIPAEAFDQSVVLVQTDGSVARGAEAVFRSLAHAPGQGGWLWLYLRLPGFAGAMEAAYRQVAGHRQLFSLLSRGLFSDPPPAHEKMRSLFLRGLGAIYLCAFLSLWFQVDGLIGSKGILPAADWLRAVREQLPGSAHFFEIPTLCWISSSDDFLRGQCAAGVLLSLFLVAGFFPAAAAALLWLLYLSLSAAGGVFLGYQWENLLLETGLLAIFFAPLRLRLKGSGEPSALMIFLLRWLLFRLMFQSGFVKLASGDPAWSGLTALQFHYQTQPLPSVLAWHVHYWPAWLHTAAAAAMFVVELAAPFLIFGPRRARLAAAILMAGLQIGIALTGNYGYFNLLSLLLCLPLLDDFVLTRQPPRPFARGRFQRWPLWMAGSAGLLILLISGIQMSLMLGRALSTPEWAESVLQAARPFRSVNQYGLFAVMTTNRWEIVLEGTTDGESWRTYEFKYKPGNVKRPPARSAPHMPRLDWQMWFAALGSYQQNPWFLQFCLQLLQGNPETLRLLESNPFPGQPPLRLRATLYEYKFTDSETRKATGEWWQREEKGPYCPELSLRGRGQ